MIIDRAQLAAALPQYVVGDPIGRGAHGLVFTARHRRLGSTHAVKVLITAESDAVAASERFLTEAQVLTALDHPHIVRVNEYAERDTVLVLVMEHLGGGTLAGRMKRPVDPAVASAWMLAVAEALSVAHRQGVVHRDIKPANLLFTTGGLLKVSDFGIAKLFAGTDASASVNIVGTPRYIAPEQISSGRIGPATDLYALGATFYELLTGHSPFPADLTMPGLLHHHLTMPPRPMEGTPPTLSALVLRLLAKNPADRPETAREFALELVAAADRDLGYDWIARSGVPLRVDSGVLRREPAPVPSPTASPGTPSLLASPGTPSPVRTPGPRRRRNVLLAAAAGVAVLAVTAVSVLVATSGDEPGKVAAPVASSASPTASPGTLAGTPALTFKSAAGADRLAINATATQIGFVGSDGRAYLRSTKPDGRVIGPLGGTATTVHDVAFAVGAREPAGDEPGRTPDGSEPLLTGGDFGDLKQWDPATGAQRDAAVSNADGQVGAVAYSLDGLTLAGADSDDGRVWLYDAGTGAVDDEGPLRATVAQDPTVNVVAFSPDRKLLAAAGYDDVHIWNLETHTLVRTIRNWTGDRAIVTLAFSPDGTRLAAGVIGQGVMVWNPATGQQVGTMIDPGSGGGEALTLGFTANGSEIRVFAGNTLTRWNADDAKPAGTPQTVHTAAVTKTAAFDSTCTAVAVGLTDGQVQLWRIS